MISNFFGISFVMGLSIMVILGMLALWIWAIVDVFNSSMSSNDKLLWFIVLLFFNIIGVLVYFLSKEGGLKTRSRKEKLQKSSDDRILAGVCGGFANYLHIDSSILRLLVVLFSIVSAGTMLFLYVVAALIMPSDDKKKEHKKNSSKTLKTVLITVSIVLVVAILTTAAVVIVAIANVAYIDNSYIESNDGGRFLDYAIAEFSAHHVIKDHETFKSLDGDELMVKSVRPLASCYDKYSDTQKTSHCFEVISTFVASDSNIMYVANSTVAEGMVQSVLIEQFSHPDMVLPGSSVASPVSDSVVISDTCKNCSGLEN